MLYIFKTHLKDNKSKSSIFKNSYKCTTKTKKKNTKLRNPHSKKSTKDLKKSVKDVDGQLLEQDSEIHLVKRYSTY